MDTIQCVNELLFFSPRSSIIALKLAHKDITLATELGRELNVPLRIASLVHEELTEALNRGWAERDSRIFMLPVTTYSAHNVYATFL